MSRPSVGVAIPAYNAAAWIAETLDSILAQTLAPDEIVVVDDGSTDGTAEVAERYADAITLVRQENRGAPAAYNRGFRTTRCDYVAMCPADDLWEPRKLEWQLDTLRAHPEVDVAFGRARFFGERDDDYPAPPATGVLEPRSFARAMYEANLIAAPTAVVRRALHERLGGFREEIAIEDYDFWMRAVRSGAVFYYDPRLLVRHRWHGENLSAKALVVWELAYEIHRAHADAVGDERLVRRVLARDLRTIGRCRLGLDRFDAAAAAYRASLRYRPTLASLAASAALAVPGSGALLSRVNRRRRSAGAGAAA